MADVKPEVHLYSEVEGLSGEVQRLPALFGLRLNTGDYAGSVQAQLWRLTVQLRQLLAHIRLQPEGTKIGTRHAT